MDPKDMTRPSGRAKIKVRKNMMQERPNPSSSFTVTVKKFISVPYGIRWQEKILLPPL
jgi:hypothetical protein